MISTLRKQRVCAFLKPIWFDSLFKYDIHKREIQLFIFNNKSLSRDWLPPLLCSKYELHSPTWTQHWQGASKYRRKLYLAVFLRLLLVAAGRLLALT